MNRLMATIPLVSKTCVRSLTTSQVRAVKPDLSRLKKKQLQFQVDNDVPVYLKGGAGDVFLYYLTLALTITSVGMSFHGLYKLSLKNK